MAVVVWLLRRHRVEPILLDGESHAKASERTPKVVQDSDLEVVLKINCPENVKLKWAVKTWNGPMRVQKSEKGTLPSIASCKRHMQRESSPCQL